MGARALLATFEGFANEGCLLPEQVWDSADIPERELFRGRASGSAMPLAWAHAEHIKLLRSLADDAVFDLPPQPKQRYQRDRVRSGLCVWRINYPALSLKVGQILRVELAEPAVLHWSADDWTTIEDTPTRDSGLAVHYVDLPTESLPAGGAVDFSILWSRENRWEGRDVRLSVEP
jgi:glucoamylase